jgi:hypothetical protein
MDKENDVKNEQNNQVKINVDDFKAILKEINFEKHNTILQSKASIKLLIQNNDHLEELMNINF